MSAPVPLSQETLSPLISDQISVISSNRYKLNIRSFPFPAPIHLDMAGSGDDHRGLFHHHKKADDALVEESVSVETTEVVVDGKHAAAVEIKKHAKKEHLAEAGAVLGGAIAMFEKHQAKKDPEHAHKHHIGEAVAGALAVGSGAYALHERHDKKDAEKEAKHHH